MESIWSKTDNLPSFPTLSENITADAAVIGGGICGILTAFFLQREGLRAVLLEANTIGSGQTHLTTAKITWQHGLIYHKLLTEQGLGAAKCYADANRRAVIQYKNLIEELSVSCFFEKLPSYLYSTTTRGRDLLLQEKSALLSLGMDCTFHSKGAHCALSVPDQAQFHPLLFLSALVSGLTIYEHTQVIKVNGKVLHTQSGHTVTAEHIVFACHYPFPIFPGMYFLKMHQERSYVVAVKQGSRKSSLPPGMFYGIDEGLPSLRTFQDMILVGGQGHRTGKNNSVCALQTLAYAPQALAFRYHALHTTAEEYFPGSTPIGQWSAQDCVTIDSLPYIGRFSSIEPNWYIATGFHKWGMSLSMAAASLLTNLICGRRDTCEAAFSPRRHLSAAAWKELSKEVKQASISLSRSAFAPGAKLDTELLRPGEGCIARINGKKTGIYKDEDNRLHFVSPHCPHMGCELHWNPEDKTWDCPCHGSRFDATGELLDNPAGKGIHMSI